jgi:hypothetical protein
VEKRNHILLIELSIATILGIACSLFYLSYLGGMGFNTAKTVFAFLYLSILFSSLDYFLLFRLILSRLSKYSQKAKVLWLAGSLLAGIWLAIAIPLPFPAMSPIPHKLEVIAIGQKDPRSQGSEVWLLGLYLPDGRKVDVTEFNLDRSWIIRDGVPVSYQNQPASLSWQSTAQGMMRLVLGTHPWSGIAQLIIDGKSQEINLYSDPGTTKEIAFQLSSPLPWYFFVIMYFGFGVIFMLLASCFLILFNKITNRKRVVVQKTSNNLSIIPPRWKWLLYALPLFLVYFFYLLIYWPGLMSPDSLDQWNQISTGIFNDWHPVFHTFFEWTLTRLWGSPASIALFQIFAMAALVSWGLTEFEKRGAPSWASWVTVGIFMVLPDFPVMTITLWKDVAYSLSILLLSILALKIVFSKGKWLESKFSWIILGGAAALVALFRHNGPPVAFGFLVIAIVFFPSFWKKWLGVIVFGAGIWLLVTGPFYSILGVTKIQEGNAIIPAISLFGIEAQVNQDISILNKTEFSYLNEILPASEWGKYTCDLATAIAFNPQFSTVSYNQFKDRLFNTFLQLTREHPQTTLNHILCATSYIWRVTQTNDHYSGSMAYNDGSAAWTTNFVKDNGFNPNYFIGTYHSTAFPQIRDFVNNTYRPFITNLTHNILSRPAIYLYLMLFSICLYAFRTSSASMLLVAMPSLIQSGVMFAVAMTPELRYQYAIMLVGTLVFLPLLTIIPLHEIDNPIQDNP